jgi:ADP-ribosylglycohydrolase
MWYNEINHDGKGYTVDDVGRLWQDILPVACTAEDEALQQLRAGTSAASAANFNGYVEWIGAAIRADAFGYACAGDPVGAAKLCYPDAYLSHRKNGIYGEMFCAAAIAAAFTAKTALDAVRAGMKQIPADSELYRALEWALSVQPQVTCYARARMLIDEHFAGMHPIHTINNMVAIVFALMLGEDDYEKSVSECIAIGLDNDCTGATVGSIVGAMVGIDGIPTHWYDRFHDTIKTYITDHGTFSIEDAVDRFVALNQ